MNTEEMSQMIQRLNDLKLEYRDLEDVVARLSGDAVVDQLQLRRWKKRKALVKDMIDKIESELIPDLDA